MQPNNTKLFLLLAALLFSGATFAQTAFDGDGLTNYIGKTATSEELKDLKTHYDLQMANEAHYLSKTGVELILQRGALSEVHLYSKSPVYGTFAGKLPGGLKFGMSSGEVKSLLGKPTASYNSGYCEFEKGNYIISCWLEGGRLNQVVIAAR
jgi:hypothetical protein